VKLLFDQNLSPFLVGRLQDVYPGSAHVREIGLATADDAAVWEFARSGGLIIVSKDSDFHERGVIQGSPPKVVWIRRGNCSTDDIEGLMRAHAGDVANLAADDTARFLILV